MPATAEPPAPAPGLTLADFDLPGAPPDNAKQGEALPDTPPAQTHDENLPENREPGVGTGGDGKPEGGDAKPKDEPPAKTLSDIMDGQVEDQKKAEADRLAAEKKTADDAATAETEKQKAAGTTQPAAERDADLKVEWGPNTHPNTKKRFNDVAAKVTTARTERDAAFKEREELRAKLADAEERAKGATASKEITEENQKLKEQIRELDITKDPELVSKYDAPIGENSKAIGEILKGEGLSEKAVADMVANPITSTSVFRYVAALRSASAKQAEAAEAETVKPAQRQAHLDEAERLSKQAEDLIYHARENERLIKQKQGEIQTWKGGYEKRIQQREAQSKQAGSERQAAIAAQSREVFTRDVEKLTKEIPFLARPTGPLPSDPPNVQKAKQSALDEYVAAEAKIQAEMKSFQTDGIPPERIPEVAGRISANAGQAVLLKTFVVPKLLRENAAHAARVKELEAQIERYENAGKLSRAQGGAPATVQTGRGEAQSLEDALGMGPV